MDMVNNNSFPFPLTFSVPGPTNEMVEDFWQMIFQENTSMIVMLTNVLENGSVGSNIRAYMIITKNKRTIGPENAHLKPDLGVLSHHEMTLTLNTHTPLLTS